MYAIVILLLRVNVYFRRFHSSSWKRTWNCCGVYVFNMVWTLWDYFRQFLAKVNQLEEKIYLLTKSRSNRRGSSRAKEKWILQQSFPMNMRSMWHSVFASISTRSQNGFVYVCSIVLLLATKCWLFSAL